MEGLLSTGPTPPSFWTIHHLIFRNLNNEPKTNCMGSMRSGLVAEESDAPEAAVMLKIDSRVTSGSEMFVMLVRGERHRNPMLVWPGTREIWIFKGSLLVCQENVVLVWSENLLLVWPENLMLVWSENYVLVWPENLVLVWPETRRGWSLW